jgi:ribosomal protein L37AE/L43A
MTPVASVPKQRLLQLRLDGEPARRSLAETARSPQRRVQCTDGGRLTLEQSLASVWEGLSAVGAADCLVCGDQMERRGAVGVCGGCGTKIS